MKILHINNQHYPKGGAHKVYFNTAKLLEVYGHKSIFFSTKDERTIKDANDYLFPDNINRRQLSLSGKIKAISKFLYNKDAYQKIKAIIEKEKPDIAHIHLFMGGLTSSILKALKENKTPIVHSVHDYRLICPAYLFIDGKNEICERCKDRHYFHCVLNRCSENNLSQSAMLTIDAYYRKYFINPLNYIDRFIFVSNFSFNKHKEFNSLYKDKADVLYNFIPDINNIKPSFNRGKFILFFGRLSREKGIQTLIEAALSANIKLKIVGTGPLMDLQLKNQNDQIEFLGFKNEKDLLDIIQNASFIIVPSEWYENNPLSILEAYANGKPVIGARIGGIPEIIDEGNTGFIFEPGNKQQLQSLLLKANSLDDAQYQVMAVNSRKFAEKFFSPEKHYEKLINIYNSTIQSYR